MGKFSQIDDIFSGDFNPTEMMQLAEDIDLSEWAAHNLKLQQTEAQRQKYTRDLTVQGEQILRDLNNERRFEEAGVSRSKMPGRGQRMQNVLGTLRSDKGEVIAPFVQQGKTKKGRAPYEGRWYTREVESPLIQGYQEVVPFEDPETGKPMMTTFADRNKVSAEGIKVDPRWQNATDGTGFYLKPQAGDRATELVGKTAAKLAGIEGVHSSNDLKVENFRNARSFADFEKQKKKLTGVDLKSSAGPLDVELRTPGKAAANVQINAFTGGERFGKLQNIQRQIGKVGLTDAAETAGYAQQPGKLSKGYDLIQLEYPQEFADANVGKVNGKFTLDTYQQDKIVEPPNKVTFLDNKTLQQEVADLGTNLDPKQVRLGGQGKVIWEAPEGTKGVKDISGTGHVPQILKNLDYVQSPETPTPLTSIARTVKNVAKNPVVRMAGVALGAVPVLGDAADASIGTYDAITKTGRAQSRGAQNAVAGIAGLTAVAAPVTAPVLAPVSAGVALGGAASDWTMERRGKDKKYTSNAGLTSPHIHTPEAPVTIQAPSAPQIVSETQRRRNARRSTGGPVARPQSAGGWWNKALGALGLQ